MSVSIHDKLRAQERAAVHHYEQAKRYLQLYRDEMDKYRKALAEADALHDWCMELKQDAWEWYGDKEE